MGDTVLLKFVEFNSAWFVILYSKSCGFFYIMHQNLELYTALIPSSSIAPKASWRYNIANRNRKKNEHERKICV